MIDGQLKFTIIPRRHASMTHEQFVQYHRERHAPLFASLAVVKQHVRRQQVRVGKTNLEQLTATRGNVSWGWPN
jgi:hypothetical protein